MVFSSSVRLVFLDKVDYYDLESFCGQKKGVEPIEKVSSSGCGSSSLSLSRFISIDCISPLFQFVEDVFPHFVRAFILRGCILRPARAIVFMISSLVE